MPYIINFIQFKDAFQNEIKNVKNRIFLIDAEIENISRLVNEPPPDPLHGPPIEKAPNILRGGVFSKKFDYHVWRLNSIHFSFTEFILKNEVDKEHRLFDPQGVELAKYFIWLKILKDKKGVTSDEVNLNLSQQLLALHYLGFNSKFPNTKTAKVLSAVLNSSESNIREKLSYLSSGQNKVRTKDNLEVVNNLFKESGIKDFPE